MKLKSLIYVLVIFVSGPGSVWAEETLEERVQFLESELFRLQGDSSSDLRAYWKSGPRLETADKAFQFKIRARIQADAAVFLDEEDANAAFITDAEEGETPKEFENGAELRRTRFGFDGRIHDRLIFKIVYDFADSDAEPKDVYVGLTGIPYVGEARVGHQREPFSRLQGSSANYIFMEKGLQNALSPGRDTGVRVLKTIIENRLRWSAGAYYESDDTGSTVDEDAYSLTARITGLPWYQNGGEQLAHLGVAYSYRRPSEETGANYSERPESHLGERFIGDGAIPADSVQLVGAEGALVFGPWSLLGEYIVADVDATAGGGPTYHGHYVTASYFLTGETRPYGMGEGRFERVTPKRNAWEEGGLGAWEVAMRYSSLDLNDSGFEQGEADNVTAALNWYLNPVTRVMFNYIYADSEGLPSFQVAQARVQLNF